MLRRFPACRIPRLIACCLVTALALGVATPLSGTFLDRATARIRLTPEERALYAEPLPNEQPAVLDTFLDRVIPPGEPRSGERAVLRISAYLSQVHPSGPPEYYMKTGAEVLQSGQNLCGDKATAAVALCRHLGMPARRVIFDNMVAIDSHTAVEVYYNNGWHFTDPSLGAFFYSRPSYDGGGEVLSLHELKANPQGERHAFFVGEARLWTGEHDPGYRFEPLAPDFKPEPWQAFSPAQAYEKAFSVAFPHFRTPEMMCSYPVEITVGEDGEAWLGQPDGSSSDLTHAGPRGGPFDRFSGTAILGQGDLTHVYHTVMLRTPGPGKYTLRYHFSQPQPWAQLAVIELKDVYLVDSAGDENGWTLVFRTQSDLALMLVVNRGGTAHLDAIRAGRVEEEHAPPA
jgi:hypothetical protein